MSASGWQKGRGAAVPSAGRRATSKGSSLSSTRNVVLRRDGGAMGAGVEVRCAEQVARGAQTFSRLGLLRHPVLVNGVAGAFCMLEGKPFAVMAFTVRGRKIVQIDILSDPERISRLDLTVLDG